MNDTTAPTRNSFIEHAETAAQHIRDTPYNLLGPAGRILRDMLDREDAERKAANPLPDNVIPFRRRKDR